MPPICWNRRCSRTESEKPNMRLPHMKRSTIARKMICTVALLCAAAWSAQAVNIVADPGFEASSDNIGGNPFSASWTNTDPFGFSGVGGDSAFAHSGTNYAFLGATPGTGSLSQGLGTTAGQFYSLSFWLANDISKGPSGNSFQVFFNGVSVFSLANQGAFAYTQFTISGLAATSGSTQLQFVSNHNNDFWRLDDIDVSAQGVPEAFSTIWLALPALAPWACCSFPVRERARASLKSKGFR